ncbi:MAG: hypothetical protein QOC94_2029, partial [Actinoplanes sp.]|nr:hypothetical protein [Actinoplanes sp.]
VRDDDRQMVIASNNGANDDPSLNLNLNADPDLHVEVPGQDFAATAEPLTGSDYDQQWKQITAKFPFFVEHQEKAGDRRIPIVALTEAD